MTANININHVQKCISYYSEYTNIVKLPNLDSDNWYQETMYNDVRLLVMLRLQNQWFRWSEVYCTLWTYIQ